MPFGYHAATPKIVWIELTSRCPFDCIFCSRRHDRGQGEHMDFELYRRILGQLDAPEIIRLNYAGESIHYPFLGEAIRLARETGAVTELVSAFASAPPRVVEELVESGLHRLSVSLHTTDAGQFREIYGLGSFDDLAARLDCLSRARESRGSAFPEVDLAFVAMSANLPQLARVADYAGHAGIGHISVHPVIRRSEIPRRFPDELNPEGELQPLFADRLAREVAAVRRAHPGLSVQVARPTGPCAGGPGLTTCEQNPWETVHVLAGGDVVVCEVQDRSPLGNLHGQTLEEIWHGKPYRRFRERYTAGRAPACRTCPWRRSAPWSRIRSVVKGTAPGPELLRGWHPVDGDGVAWSHREAALVLRQPAGAGDLHLTGMLPPGPGGRPNTLTVACEGHPLAEWVNESGQLLKVDFKTGLVPHRDGHRLLSLTTAHRYCPAREQGVQDLRELGFALLSAAFEGVGRRRERAVACLFATLECVDAWCRKRRRTWLRPDPAWNRPGVSVIIPERANPERLARCLASVHAAGIGEPVEIIVVVNGSGRGDYLDLLGQADFQFHRRPMGFAEAIVAGLGRARYPWVYLLNNDMTLLPGALAEVLRYRDPETFAVASRIEMEDPALAGTETNWTDYEYEDGVIRLLERDPRGLVDARGSLYAGGGSALFQARLLRAMARHGRAYAPFYWEDAEWGATAWRHGFRTVFCPASAARHGYRRTVGRFYAPEEVDRIFTRNRYLFQLRNLEAPLGQLRAGLVDLDQTTWREIFSPATLAAICGGRARAARSPLGEAALRERWRAAFTSTA